MARLEDIPEPERSHLVSKACPHFETTPMVGGPRLGERRIAMVTTAGLHRRGDRPFTLRSDDYRIIPAATRASDLVMSHVSTNFDRTGFQQDHNVILPIDRLRELEEARVIGAGADYHYAFMGATLPEEMESAVRHLAVLLKRDKVNGVLLIPV